MVFLYYAKKSKASVLVGLITTHREMLISSTLRQSAAVVGLSTIIKKD